MSLLRDGGEGGWTVILRRVDATVTFNRVWSAYRNGFGDFNGNFWLGLQKIKDITDHSVFELYIGMERYMGGVGYARYDSFSLDDESANYKLSLGAYNPTHTISTAQAAGDALTATHNGKEFSTSDDDNDGSNSNHCAAVNMAGWWYDNCHDSHLTGMYYPGPEGLFASGQVPDGIVWKTWTVTTPTISESLKTVVMAVRPVV